MTATLNQIWLTIYNAGDVVEVFHSEATAHASIRPGCEAIREVTWITGPGTRPPQPTAQPKDARMKAQKKRRAGRKLAQGVQRYPGGQIIRPHRKPVETQQQVLATVTAQPHRRGFSDSQNAFLGYPIGRLFYTGQISEDQRLAGEWYGRLWLDYHRKVTGIVPPKVSAQLQEYIAAGDVPLSHGNDNEDWEAVARLRARWGGLQSAFADRGLLMRGNAMLPMVCVHDREPPLSAIGDLRELLNIVDKYRQKRA